MTVTAMWEAMDALNARKAAALGDDPEAPQPQGEDQDQAWRLILSGMDIDLDELDDLAVQMARQMLAMLGPVVVASVGGSPLPVVLKMAAFDAFAAGVYYEQNRER